jgi:hypothetical protein
MITPDQPTAPKGEQCVPLAALAIDGTPPSVGDEVEFTARARIERIEGDEAYIKTTSVNNTPVASDDDMAAEEIMRMAMEADAQG